MVEGGALEKRCTERYLGFESLPLRQLYEAKDSPDVIWIFIYGSRDPDYNKKTGNIGGIPTSPPGFVQKLSCLNYAWLRLKIGRSSILRSREAWRLSCDRLRQKLNVFDYAGLADESGEAKHKSILAKPEAPKPAGRQVKTFERSRIRYFESSKCG